MEGTFTISKIAEIFPMESLTVEGLETAINKLRSRQAVQL
jgi:hypothetical protein